MKESDDDNENNVEVAVLKKGEFQLDERSTGFQTNPDSPVAGDLEGTLMPKTRRPHFGQDPSVRARASSQDGEVRNLYTKKDA